MRFPCSCWSPHVEPLWLDGVEVGVGAQIHSLSGYSAHADQQELLTFVQDMRSPPRAIRLVHGEMVNPRRSRR